MCLFDKGNYPPASDQESRLEAMTSNQLMSKLTESSPQSRHMCVDADTSVSFEGSEKWHVVIYHRALERHSMLKIDVSVSACTFVFSRQ